MGPRRQQQHKSGAVGPRSSRQDILGILQEEPRVSSINLFNGHRLLPLLLLSASLLWGNKKGNFAAEKEQSRREGGAYRGSNIGIL